MALYYITAGIVLSRKLVNQISNFVAQAVTTLLLLLDFWYCNVSQIKWKPQPLLDNTLF